MQLRELFDELPTTDGAVVPIALQQLLRSELDVSKDWQVAETVLLSALEALPDQMEIRIALYKLYAYSNRFDEALSQIHEVLGRTASQSGFDADWNKLNLHSTNWYPARGAMRQYLYSLKAMGFVRLRRGDIDLAHAALSKLLELDPQDQVGGTVVYEMAERLYSPHSAANE